MRGETIYKIKFLAPVLSHKFLELYPDRFYRPSARFFFNPVLNSGDLERKGESKNLNIERPTLNVEEGCRFAPRIMKLESYHPGF